MALRPTPARTPTAVALQVQGRNAKERKPELSVILRSGGSARRSRSRRCAGTMNIGGASFCWNHYGRKNRASRYSTGWNRGARKNSGSSRAWRPSYLLRRRSHTGRYSSYWTCTYTALLATCCSAPWSRHGASKNACANTETRARWAAAHLCRNGCPSAKTNKSNE